MASLADYQKLVAKFQKLQQCILQLESVGLTLFRSNPCLLDPEKFDGVIYKFDTWLIPIKAKLRLDKDATGPELEARYRRQGVLGAIQRRWSSLSTYAQEACDLALDAAIREHSRFATLLATDTTDIHPDTISATDSVFHLHAGINFTPSLLARALKTIWRATSKAQLGQLLSGSTKEYRRLGFNFSTCGGEDDRARRSPKTVEF
ncbi:hypothetical protein DL766_000600 [Monosporascus sp. MC13-8B]|uniref:Uncharacterized protein n=1 Tax=Monosporascus cannonballus TaxID=155416 RepID=A0ABY0HK44_9PEZI|nr:hypothetical protein DL762_000647 [Monosporascus cannonballus]RYP01408.1 hypothetical protein DL763_000218 [Monosporascus cannonballus]RYP39058.1 hypothetical protein DL766_000600 [Monosporascus sp. MC13-8B]